MKSRSAPTKKDSTFYRTTKGMKAGGADPSGGRNGSRYSDIGFNCGDFAPDGRDVRKLLNVGTIAASRQ